MRLNCWQSPVTMTVFQSPLTIALRTHFADASVELRWLRAGISLFKKYPK